MATAKKLPSGSWRVRIYDRTDSNGKRIYSSFTAPTKQQAELLGAQHKAKKGRRSRGDLTVVEAVDAYIELKTPLLSPSTVKEYKDVLGDIGKTAIASIRLKQLTADDVQQKFINALIAKGLAARTVQKDYRVLKAALAHHDETFYTTLKRVDLPSATPDDGPALSDNEVSLLLEKSTGITRKGIILGACSLRAGEACALKYGDITPDGLHVHATMVRTPADTWDYKPTPKTSASFRTSPLPDEFREILGSGDPDKYILDGIEPKALSDRFSRLRDKLGISKRYHFHSLRSYFASRLAMEGVPDVVTAKLGGWSPGSGALKRIYQKVQDEKLDTFKTRINKGLAELVKK